MLAPSILLSCMQRSLDMTASVRCNLNPSFATIRRVPRTTQYPFELNTAGASGCRPAEQDHAPRTSYRAGRGASRRR